MVDTNFGSTAAAAAAGAAAAQEYQMKVQNASPTNGQTVVMIDDDKDRTLSLTPAGSLATLTVTFPSDANSRDGQIAIIASTHDITVLDVTPGVTVLGFVPSLSSNDAFAYQKTSANTWVRLQ